MNFTTKQLTTKQLATDIRISVTAQYEDKINNLLDSGIELSEQSRIFVLDHRREVINELVPMFIKHYEANPFVANQHPDTPSWSFDDDLYDSDNVWRYALYIICTKHKFIDPLLNETFVNPTPHTKDLISGWV